MLQVVLDVVWLLLPAGVANTIPVIAAKYNWLPTLAKPISLKHLGANKTYRGLVLGIVFGAATGVMMHHGAVLGAALGAGALTGDAVKSFFKRKRNLAPGQPWPVFDQIDYVIGALVVATFFLPLTLGHVVVAIVLFGLLSLCISYLGIKLNIKKSL